MNEINRIQHAYQKRDESGVRLLYSCFNPASLYSFHQREFDIIDILRSKGRADLSKRMILDLGCGTGNVLRDFIRYGAAPENCYGIDLLSDRIGAAKRINPNIDFRVANAEELPYETGFFDIILSFTVFTSIFDKDMKYNIAKEMLRVLNPEGFIIWYDYHMNNPKNTDVRGVKKREIQSLFQNCDIQLKRVTLAPPITRLLAPRSYMVCRFLEKMKILNTHYIGIIKKI